MQPPSYVQVVFDQNITYHSTAIHACTLGDKAELQARMHVPTSLGELQFSNVPAVWLSLEGELKWR